jgi:RNA polymerase sigma-70 factor (ECF subfamily)
VAQQQARTVGPASPAGAALAGVPRPLAQLFERYFDEVYRFCLARSGSTMRAEDAAAETFADAARLFASGRGGEVSVGWLYSVARRRVIDQWRRSERERRRLEVLVAQPPAGPDDVVMESDETVLKALADLPDAQRAALVLRYVDGMSVSEVADALGTSYRSAESTLARARRSFRRSHQEART